MIRTVAIVAALLSASCSRTDKDAAVRAAQEYQSHFPDATGVECADTDSDGDGYVSCTIFRKDHDPYGIECGGERYCVWNCARGCKVITYKVRRAGGGQ